VQESSALVPSTVRHHGCDGSARGSGHTVSVPLISSMVRAPIRQRTEAACDAFVLAWVGFAACLDVSSSCDMPSPAVTLGFVCLMLERVACD
jgi:hypothetical protein